MSALLSPTVVLGVLLCGTYACLFHLWLGRSLGSLLIYLIAAWIGFAIGQTIGLGIGASVLRVGQVHLLEGSIGAWLLMFAVQLFGGQK